MPLAPYSEKYWFPNGSSAQGEQAFVFTRADSVLASLFQDQAGTVPLPNPLVIGPGGMLTFFVENGDYWVYVNGQSFYVIVDLDEELSQVWPVLHFLGVVRQGGILNLGLSARDTWDTYVSDASAVLDSNRNTYYRDSVAGALPANFGAIAGTIQGPSVAAQLG